MIKSISKNCLDRFPVAWTIIPCHSERRTTALGSFSHSLTQQTSLWYSLSIFYVTGIAMSTENSTANKKTSSPCSAKFTCRWNKQTIYIPVVMCTLKENQADEEIKECRGGLFWIECLRNMSLGWYLSRTENMRSNERTFLEEMKRYRARMLMSKRGCHILETA